MPSPSRHIRYSLVVIALVVAMTLVSCGPEGDGSGEKGTGDRSATSSASATATTQAASGTASSSGGSEPLAPADAKAIGQQLDAIERELDNLEMPSDSDFEGIEDSLR